MWISPKQAAAEMSMTAFKNGYEQVVIPLGGDEHFSVDECSVSLSDGSWTTPCVPLVQSARVRISFCLSLLGYSVTSSADWGN